MEAKRSCTAIHLFASCVQKAKAHLAALRRNLRSSTEYATSRQELEDAVSAQQGMLQTNSAFFLPSDQLNDSLRSTALGVGETDSAVCEDTTCDAVRSSRGEAVAAAKQRSARYPGLSVVAEVEVLLSRLDKAQHSLVELVNDQQGVVDRLEHDLKKLEMYRLRQLPLAVHKEHSECSQDLSELAWHIEFNQRTLEKVNEDLAVVEQQHDNLLDDMNFFEVFKPHTVEKLQLEKLMIEDLTKQHKQVTAELQRQMKSRENAKKDREKMNGIAKVKREQMRQQLLNIEEMLDDTRSNLVRAQLLHSSNLNTVIKCREDTTRRRVTIEKVEKLIEEQEKKEMHLQAKMDTIKESLTDTLQEHHALRKINNQLETELNEVRSEQLEEEERLESKRFDAVKRHHAVQEKKKDLADSINELKEDTTRRKKQCTKDSKGIKRSHGELQRLEEQLKVSNEEYTEVNRLHQQITSQVKTEEKLAADAEHSLEVTRQKLEEQVEEELQWKMLTEARILADERDMGTTKKVMEEKVEKGSEIARISEEENAVLSEEVTSLETDWFACDKTLSCLRSEKAKLTMQVEDTEKRLLASINELQTNATSMRGTVESNQALIKELNWEESMLKKKIEGISESSAVVQRIINDTEAEIQKLAVMLKQHQVTLREGWQAEESLKVELKKIRDFRAELASKHALYMEMERSMLRQHKSDLQKAVNENTRLADRYKLSQGKSMEAKAQLTTVLEQRSQVEASLRDHKQLIDWQRRMQHVLQSVYRSRQHNCRRSLAEFLTAIKQNTATLATAEKDLRTAVEHVQTFLEAESF